MSDCRFGVSPVNYPDLDTEPRLMSSTKVKTYRKKEKKDNHALRLDSGFCCEPLRSPHGLCRKCSEKNIASHHKGFDPSLVDLDLIHNDRIYKCKAP